MNRFSLLPLGIAVAILVAVFFFTTCTYVLHEREQAVIVRFQRPIKVVVGEDDPVRFEAVKQEILEAVKRPDLASDANIETGAEIQVSQGAGLRFKLPFGIDKVQRFPDVVLEYDAEPREIVLADKKKLEVDNFARWRIINPLVYRVSVQSERNARERLDDVIYSQMRAELGKSPLIEVIRTTDRYAGMDLPTLDDAAASGDELELATVLSEQSPMRETIERGREEIMRTVTENADAVTRKQYGIQIIDVRIKRADLLKENLEAVFGRMQAERKRISDAYRSEGQKEADIIKGETDRQVAVISANAERDAKILRGEGDAQSLNIISQSFGTNPELYRYMRSLEVLSQSTPKGSEVVIGLDSGLFHLLQTDTLADP